MGEPVLWQNIRRPEAQRVSRKVGTEVCVTPFKHADEADTSVSLALYPAREHGGGGGEAHRVLEEKLQMGTRFFG